MAKQVRSPRAARVSVPNQEQAIISAEGTNTIGILHKLSLTGGLVRLPKEPFRRGTLATLAVKTATGRISAAVEFLASAHYGARTQAFRFIHMDPADRRQLEAALQHMLRQGFGDQQRRAFRLGELAQRAFGVARDGARQLKIGNLKI